MERETYLKNKGKLKLKGSRRKFMASYKKSLSKKGQKIIRMIN